jgi:hypothetical protein
MYAVVMAAECGIVGLPSVNRKLASGSAAKCIQKSSSLNYA